MLDGDTEYLIAKQSNLVEMSWTPKNMKQRDFICELSSPVAHA